MKLIDSISSNFNYTATTLDGCVVKIMTNPSAFKKALQFSTRVYAACDLLLATQLAPSPLANVMKGTVEIIDFYSTYKNMKFWLNLFSKESLDEKALKKSIESSLCASHKQNNDILDQKRIAQFVFNEVMSKQAYYSKGGVYEALEASLKNQGYSPNKAKQIADRVIVQQKSRSAAQLIYMACFTVTDLTGNLMTLKKWGIADLSHLAASMGSQSRVFMFIVETGVDTVLGTVAAAGLVLVVGEATYKSIQAGIKHYHAATPEDKEKAYKELRNALLDLLAGSVDLVATAVPLMVTLNPPVVIGLAIVAKGTGLICILVR